jgi:hypothetical protein
MLPTLVTPSYRTFFPILSIVDMDLLVPTLNSWMNLINRLHCATVTLIKHKVQVYVLVLRRSIQRWVMDALATGTHSSLFFVYVLVSCDITPHR